MYKKSDKLRRFLAILTLFCLFSLSAAEGQDSLLSDLDMGKTSYSWLSVLSGSGLGKPVKSSYGWVEVTEGKMVCAWTESGKVLWQKGLPASASSLLSVDPDDFSAVILRNKKLCLLNPSGLVLWQKPLSFEALHPPLFGRDGRIFVFGKDKAACFGMNGIQKWEEKFEAISSRLPPAALDDGSVAVFLEALSDNKSQAVRISPFGENLERIVFASKVSAALSVRAGLLLAFDDKSAGLCSADKSGGKSEWVIKGLSIGENPRLLSLEPEGLAALVSSAATGTSVCVINVQKGAAEKAFLAPDIKNIKEAFSCPDGIFLAAPDFGALYSLSGKRIRGAIFPPKTKKFNWDNVLYAKNGSVLLTSKNWSLAGWRLVKAAAERKPLKPRRLGYENFYKDEPLDFFSAKEGSSVSRKEELEKGGYGKKERDFLLSSQAILDSWFIKNMSKNSVGGAIGSLSNDELFSFSLSDETAAISMLGLFGTAGQAKTLSRILTQAKDESVLIPALKAVQDFGYDPEGLLLDALELLAKNSNPSREALLGELCSSLYSLCRFMGRSALSKKGLKILQTLQLPQYSNSTKEEARNVYEKLAKLKM